VAVRRETLIDSGWQLLMSEGPDAVTPDRVVRELGVGPEVFGEHFDDRSDLLLALYERYADDMVHTQEPVLYREDLPMEGLLAASRATYYDMVAAHGAVIRPLVDALQGDKRLDVARGLLRERLLAMWTVAVSFRLTEREREIFARDDEARVAVATVLELLSVLAQDAATLWLSGERDRETVEQMLTLMTAGIHARLMDHLMREL
jgi:AcrR family transcriptional regulator